MPSPPSPPFGDTHHHPFRVPGANDDDDIAGTLPPSSFDDSDASYSLLNSYPTEEDYYAVLGLPRTPPPSDPEIRSAYKSLTLSFHPDKQPAHLRQTAEKHFDRIRAAYETLIDPEKRVVYDLLGAEAVKEQWGIQGVMGRGGEAEKEREKEWRVGTRARTPEEFRKWFLGRMKMRERGVVEGLVQSRGHFTFGIDASDMISVDHEAGEVYVNVPSVKPSSYAVGVSFKAPFPTLKTILGDTEEEEEEKEGEEGEENETEQSKKNDATEKIDTTDMTISASITGGLIRPSRKFTVAYEDGIKEERPLPLPLILSAKQINLGAHMTHRFGDVSSMKGLFGMRPFSFLSNSGVMVNALLLPVPAVQTAITKAITLVPGTKPFGVNLSSTVNRSLFSALPSLGLQVSKEVAEKKLVFCNWTSGTMFYPESIQEMFSSIVDLSMDVESLFALPNETSQFQVGFLSLPKSKPAVSLDDDGEEEEEDPEHERLRVKKREINKAAESWQVQASANPMGAALSMTYSRNVFSGKAANDPARSEWSSEGHYPVPPEVEPRSVRVGIETTLGIDLSLGWNIEAVRQVGDFTRMGLGVGVQGTQGIVMTVSWNRLGQRIKLPISVCALESVNTDAAALVVIFPWIAYCAVEFGFIRPRERKKHRRLMARRQRELKKAIPKKRAESTQVIELMAEQVQRRQAREEAQGGLVITKAEYGQTPAAKKKKDKSSTIEWEPTDVTIPVAALVDRGQLVIARETAKFQILGFHDPAPLLPKKLKIWYKYHGKEHFVEANDWEGVTCPMRSHLLD